MEKALKNADINQRPDTASTINEFNAPSDIHGLPSDVIKRIEYGIDYAIKTYPNTLKLLENA